MTKTWSPQTLARWIGVLLLISILFGGFGEMYVLDQLIVPRDADATAGNIFHHHPLTIHGAPGNRTSDRRRRALAVRYTGDDARYAPRPGTFMEMESVRAHVPAPGLQSGDPLGGDLFPEVWREPTSPARTSR